MFTSGFTNAPVSRLFLFSFIATSILVSITDSKYLFNLLVVPHFWPYKQVWRVFLWQVRRVKSSNDIQQYDIAESNKIVSHVTPTRPKFCSQP